MKSLFTITALFLSGCGIFELTEHKPTAHEPTDTDKCDEACDRLNELGCPEGLPLEDGTSCTEFCVDTQESGHGLDPTCVSTLEKCADLNTQCGM